MKSRLFAAAVTAAFSLLSWGCATKGQQTYSRAGKVVSQKSPSKSFSATKEQESNPILLEEEFEAREQGEPSFDIPVVRNAKVEQWIAYFQGRGAKWYRLWLERSGKYIPMMRKILKDHGLPEDLVYLAMIESGFSPRAFSRARAVGPWQFMKATGRMYNLRVDFWIDERRDPEKATIAAARHLKDLYDQFQSWKLAAAAYNAGSGKVSRAIRRYRTEDFWELAKGRYLKPETKHYVPKLIAAALIAKDPESYGFTDITYQDPLSYDKVILQEAVDLNRLADRAGIDIEELRALNPELNFSFSPPNVQNYELRVPTGSSEKVLIAYNAMSPEERFRATVHVVRKGESLGALANKYGIPAVEIQRANQMGASKNLRVGRSLIIPVPQGVDVRKSPGYRMAAMTNTTGTHRVRSGQTLGSIARLYRTTVRRLKEANNLTSTRIRVGQVLRVPSIEYQSMRNTNSNPRVVHVVRRGETLTAIAESYGTSIQAIQTKNQLRRTTIHPGKRLLIPTT